MIPRFVGSLLIGLVIATYVTAPASATTLNYLYLDAGPYYGVRSNIGNPSSGEANISSGDFFVTSVFALTSESSANQALQQGVTYEWNVAQNSCNLGSQGNGAKMYYFTETYAGGTYTCYNGGIANSATSHKQSLTYNTTSQKWSAYLDGMYTGIQMFFYDCYGLACSIRAFGENHAAKPGLWKTKFAGAGNTPWQYYNSSIWVTISGYSTHPGGSDWSSLSGPFPTGIWSFTYSH